MRYTLWPEDTELRLRDEMKKILIGNGFDNGELSWNVFVLERENGNLGAFVEITIYPELSFCKSNNIGYIEGWFVDEELRNKGVGKQLIDMAEKWLISQACTEIASDVEKDNFVSQKAHKALGFEETHEENGCFFYKKALNSK